MVLKAACIADEGNFRTAALAQGVTARCGPAVLQTISYGQYFGTCLMQGRVMLMQSVRKNITLVTMAVESCVPLCLHLHPIVLILLIC